MLASLNGDERLRLTLKKTTLSRTTQASKWWTYLEIQDARFGNTQFGRGKWHV